MSIDEIEILADDLGLEEGLKIDVTKEHIHAFLHFNTDPIKAAIMSTLIKRGRRHIQIEYVCVDGVCQAEIPHLEWILFTDVGNAEVGCRAPKEVFDFFNTRKTKQALDFKPFSFVLRW